MSEPFPPAPGEQPVPPKKKKAGKIILIVVLAVVVLCGVLGVAGYFLLGKAADVLYSEGMCVDSVSTASSTVPTAVKCSDAKAAAKILKVADDKTQADAEAICGTVPGADSYIVLTIQGKNKLLCLGPK